MRVSRPNKKQIARFLFQALILMMSGLLSCPSSPTAGLTQETCEKPEDCEGLPHVTCEGTWQCTQGLCEWRCNEQPQNPQNPCIEGGCFGEICSSEPAYSPCVPKTWFDCLILTECGQFGKDGTCAFKPTPDFLDCLQKNNTCKDDTDCPSGYICKDSKCIFETSANLCKTSEDCMLGQFCTTMTGDCRHDPSCDTCTGCFGICIEDREKGRCEHDEDCAQGYYCNPETHMCEKRVCFTDKDCDDNNDCTKDTCYQGSCINETIVGCGLCQIDEDGDGFFEDCDPTDCDDKNPNIHPFAKELCDHIDNDCNGKTDEGCEEVRCYSDKDCPPSSWCDLASFTCKLKEGYCYHDSDCRANERCEGAITCLGVPSCVPKAGRCMGKQDCFWDNDCEPGFYCNLKIDGAGAVNGQCTELPEGKCVRDEDCAEGSGCVFGACPSCYPCPCFGECMSTMPKSCLWHYDCPSGFMCDGSCGGQCKKLRPNECFYDKDCDIGYRCSGAVICPPCSMCFVASSPGRCIENFCSDSKDCPPNQVCKTEQICPPCVFEDPPCMAPCTVLSYCVMLCFTPSDCPPDYLCDMSSCGASLCNPPFECKPKGD